jgi:hypothetical protein
VYGPRVRIGLPQPGWSLSLWPVPVPADLGGRYDALAAGSVVMLLSSPGRCAEAVWERGRCGGRGGWLLLEAPGPLASLSSPRPFVIPALRATASLEGVLRRMAPLVGLSPGGPVVRSALRRFPPGDVRLLSEALRVMES